MMKKSPPPYCSPSMLAMLRNIAAERPLTEGLTGRSAHGGASGTLAALISRDWVNSWHGGTVKITEAGRARLEASK